MSIKTPLRCRSSILGAFSCLAFRSKTKLKSFNYRQPNHNCGRANKILTEKHHAINTRRIPSLLVQAPRFISLRLKKEHVTLTSKLNRINQSSRTIATEQLNTDRE